MKFELFMCCQGNGITLCNKAVEENYDYKNNRSHITRGKHQIICRRKLHSI